MLVVKNNIEAQIAVYPILLCHGNGQVPDAWILSICCGPLMVSALSITFSRVLHMASPLTVSRSISNIFCSMRRNDVDWGVLNT